MTWSNNLHRQFALNAYEDLATNNGSITKLQDAIAFIRDQMIVLNGGNTPKGLGHNGLPGEYLNVMAVNLTLFRSHIKTPTEVTLDSCLEDFFDRFSRPSKGSVNLPDTVPAGEISGLAIGRLINETSDWLNNHDMPEDRKQALIEALEICRVEHEKIINFAARFQNSKVTPEIN